ncbi:hypothetical protein KKF61_08905 [Patescibacteria group bacterium]|nr:hypothetical protein [Patescibacteria group bacterium]
MSSNKPEDDLMIDGGLDFSAEVKGAGPGGDTPTDLPTAIKLLGKKRRGQSRRRTFSLPNLLMSQVERHVYQRKAEGEQLTLSGFAEQAFTDLLKKLERKEKKASL